MHPHLSAMQMLRCIELDERLRAMDQEITVNPQFVQKVTGAPSLTEWARRGRVASSIRSVSLCPEAILGRLTETYSLGTFPDSRLEVCLGMRVGVLDLPTPHTGWCPRGRRCPGAGGKPLARADKRTASLPPSQSMGSQEDDSGNKPSSYS